MWLSLEIYHIKIPHDLVEMILVSALTLQSRASSYASSVWCAFFFFFLGLGAMGPSFGSFTCSSSVSWLGGVPLSWACSPPTWPASLSFSSSVATLHFSTATNAQDGHIQASKLIIAMIFMPLHSNMVEWSTLEYWRTDRYASSTHQLVRVGWYWAHRMP